MYFNQATLYQTSETGYATVREAVKAEGSGYMNYNTCIQEAFTKHAKYIWIKAVA